MNKLSCIAFVLFLLLVANGAVGQDSVARYGYRIVNTYPHDTGAFTQGLKYHGGFIYEGTGKHGQSRLSRARLETGEV
ncbi:MAG: glutaminyl-peptide cyclotransferase, partial [Pseudomonadales bacterium]